MSLLERKELLEKEISKLQYECSQLYFSIVTHKTGEHMLYSDKRTKLAELESDLFNINEILAKQ